MLEIIKVKQSHANNSVLIMGPKTIQNNGAESKSQMSRNNFLNKFSMKRTIFCFMMAAALFAAVLSSCEKEKNNGGGGSNSLLSVTISVVDGSQYSNEIDVVKLTVKDPVDYKLVLS